MADQVRWCAPLRPLIRTGPFWGRRIPNRDRGCGSLSRAMRYYARTSGGVRPRGPRKYMTRRQWEPSPGIGGPLGVPAGAASWTLTGGGRSVFVLGGTPARDWWRQGSSPPLTWPECLGVWVMGAKFSESNIGTTPRAPRCLTRPGGRPRRHAGAQKDELRKIESPEVSKIRACLEPRPGTTRLWNGGVGRSIFLPDVAGSSPGRNTPGFPVFRSAPGPGGIDGNGCRESRGTARKDSDYNRAGEP